MESPDSNVEAMQRRAQKKRLWAWILVFLAPLVMLASCILSASLPMGSGAGNVGLWVGVMGVPVAGGGCVVLAAMLFIKARRDRDILEMMVATGRERSAEAFQRLNLFNSRILVHSHCGTQIPVSGPLYYCLCDPFDLWTRRFQCGNCGRVVDLDGIHWLDTGETLANYRRLRSGASAFTWFSRLAFPALLGGGMALGLMLWLAKPETPRAWVETGTAVLFGIFWFMSMSRIVTLFGWRQKRWARP